MKNVVVCAPRTGSTSFTEFLANAYRINGIDADVRHDSDGLLPLAVRDFVVDGSEEKLQACVDNWSHDAEVTTYSLGFVLEPLLRKLGDGVKVVVLNRNHDRVIESICKRIDSYPEGYDGYVEAAPISDSPRIRPCAPHFGAMSWDDWWALDRRGRVAWYVNALYERAADALQRTGTDSMNVTIDDLNDEVARRRIVDFVLDMPDAKVPRSSVMHLMAGFSFLPADLYRQIDELLGEFDWSRLTEDQTALLRHLLEHHIDKGQAAEAIATIGAVIKERDPEN